MTTRASRAPGWPRAPCLAELVAICVPGPDVFGVVDEAVSAGSRVFLTISAGVTEPSRPAALLDRRHARMIGPHSLGLYDSSAQLELAWGHFARAGSRTSRRVAR